MAKGPGVLPNSPLMPLPPFCYVSGVSECLTESWSGPEWRSSVWLSPILLATWNWPYFSVCKPQKLSEGLAPLAWLMVTMQGCSLEWQTFGLEFPLPTGAPTVEDPTWTGLGSKLKCILFLSPMQKDAGIQAWPPWSSGHQHRGDNCENLGIAFFPPSAILFQMFILKILNYAMNICIHSLIHIQALQKSRKPPWLPFLIPSSYYQLIL